ncbi:hypothetical protein PM10SUCC1_32560 [Propionigenium maris DSM 9537]|uniref:Uncharacterized protein n=1 Tax=Propionigenium maris DSM 9537 TaxID=1123000 RepID=A0A9W6GNP2_9FUSO|nr:hypothetical protein [Propionigenium maris]GLI57742.1 hypothetical protein PM10SUCC1_32560 [Propionigenium maris DSM 9537]
MALHEQFEKIIEEVEELDYALQCECEERVTQEAIDVMRALKGFLDILAEKHGIDVNEALLENDGSVTSRYAVAKRRNGLSERG